MLLFLRLLGSCRMSLQDSSASFSMHFRRVKRRLKESLLRAEAVSAVEQARMKYAMKYAMMAMMAMEFGGIRTSNCFGT